MALLQGASASASSSSPLWRYRVFLSFRGEDVRNNFVAHLYEALDRKGINTYIDYKLERGEEISAGLFEAIEGSMISIIILSPHYASSTWCLKELMKIVECKETKQQIVLPVFYYVDPSDVSHQTNTFDEAFSKHEVRFKDDKENVQRWKAALTEVSKLAGFHLKKERNESEFIHEIIQRVDNIIVQHTSRVSIYSVGIESRVQDICLLLCLGNNDIRIGGIFGIGGIGKTTIAKEIYNSIAYQFEATCFLPNVRETSVGACGLVKLQEKLLSKILGDSKLKVETDDQGINLIKERFCCKKILLIIDDVDQLKQLKKLAGERDWFGSGSRIIITTRDQNLLTNHDVDFTYEVGRLNPEESLQLFSKSAFKGDNPPVEYRELVEQIINYAGGLPLALEVLGSDLHGKSICEWKSALKDYKGHPHKDIQEVLRISYDGLGPNEKKIFLDIACFFKGENKDKVIQILDNCDFSAIIGIRRLMDKCLITTTDSSELEMHDLLQEMGREIIREESPEELGGRSRLWFHEDVRMVLQENMGTNKIEAIVVDLPEGGDIIQLSPVAFMEMKRLRLFIIRNARFSREVSLPNELRVLIWYRYDLPSLPYNFHGKKFFYLEMRRSLIQDVRVVEHMINLTVLNFCFCKLLTKIPNLSRHPNLKELILTHCENLEDIHDSVGGLDKLVRLDLSKCSKLRCFPRSIKLRSLEDLNFSYSSSLLNFPEIEGEMKNLKKFEVEESGIKELPSSIRNISGLLELHIIKCKNLTHLPGSILQLQHLEFLRIEGCPRFKGFRENQMEDNTSLNKLFLSETGIVSLPASIKRFVGLRVLRLNNCKQLQEILELPKNMKEIHAVGCISLESFPQVSEKFQFNTSDNSLDKLILLDLRGCNKMLKKLRNPVLSPSLRKDYVLDGIEDSREGRPTWFSHCENSLYANSCRINVNRQECLEEAITIALCAVIILSAPLGELQWKGKINASAFIVREGHSRRPVEGTTAFIGKNKSTWDSPHLFLAYTTVEPSELEGNHLEVKFLASSCSEHEIEIVSCEVHRVHEHKERVEARKMRNENIGVLRGGSDVRMDVSNAEPENLLDLLSMIQLYQSSKRPIGKQYSRWGK